MYQFTELAFSKREYPVHVCIGKRICRSTVSGVYVRLIMSSLNPTKLCYAGGGGIAMFCVCVLVHFCESVTRYLKRYFSSW